MHEERLTLPDVGAGDIPVSVWLPTGRPRGIVLMGHGLGVDRYHDSVQKPTHLLTGAHQLAVIASDLPLHGLRKADLRDPIEIVDQWHAFWAEGGVRLLQQEWAAILGYGRARLPRLPCAYFGFLGLFGSHSAPRTPVMNTYAPRVCCPIYFIQKQDDELHPLETSQHLFSILGSDTKTLDSSPGLHSEVDRASFENACTFISKHM